MKYTGQFNSAASMNGPSGNSAGSPRKLHVTERPVRDTDVLSATSAIHSRASTIACMLMTDSGPSRAEGINLDEIVDCAGICLFQKFHELL